MRAAEQRGALAHRHQAEARAARLSGIDAPCRGPRPRAPAHPARSAAAPTRASAPECRATLLSASCSTRYTWMAPGRIDRPRRRRCARSATSMPSCFSTVERYQSIVLSSPSSSRIDGCSVCDRPRTLSSAVCAISPISRRSARSGEPSGACLPARPSIEPIAVRIWPNSSCSSREISRSVDSRVAISVCASSRRSSDSVASSREQPPVRANQVQAGGDDRRQRRGEEPVDLPLHPAVDVLHLLRGLLLGLVVLHEQPRHRGAERRLPRLQRQLDLRARLVFLSGARQREDAVRRRPRTARARLARYCALLRRPPRQRHRSLLLQRIVQIEADAIELRRPRGERIAARRHRACRASPARAG